jgi:hypothetical protein
MYANRVNLSGLLSKKPIKIRQGESYGDKEWWHDNKDFIVDKIGLNITDGYIDFASENYDEVLAWTQGANAVMTMIHQWSKT